jgi:hypothetical protein
MIKQLSSALLVVALASATSAQSILVLNGNGSNSVASPLQTAGFTVINGTLDPGQISGPLSVQNDISQIWIWNDGTYGNTGTPANPARDFDAADLAALASFNQSHSKFIMDCFAWRSNGNQDQKNFTMNAALALEGAGGGIVLGTDDASGAALVQHVNQVTDLFGFNPFEGVYITSAAIQFAGGDLLSSPNVVNPTALVGTTSYAQAPHGAQPNGRLLAPAIFGSPSTPWSGQSSPPLGSEVIDGVLYTDVNYLVTTDLDGGGFSDFTTFCFADGAAVSCPCGNDDPNGGCQNSTAAGAVLAATGTASLGSNDMFLSLTNMPPNVNSILFTGDQQVNIVLGNGIRCVGGAVRRSVPVNTGPNGTVSGNAFPGALFLPGETAYFQAWYQDFSGPCGAVHSVSNAVGVTFAP